MVSSRPVVRHSKYLRIALSIAISGLTLFLAVRGISWRDMASSLMQVSIGFLFLALACVVANNLLKIIRWKVLMGEFGQEVGIILITRAFIVGQLLNLFYPFRVGDLNRPFLVAGTAQKRAFVFGTIALEKLIDLECYAFLLLLLMLLFPLPVWINHSIFGLISLAVIIVVFLILAGSQSFGLSGILNWILKKKPGWITERVWQHWGSWFQSGLDSLEVLKDQKGMFKVALCSVLIWGVGALTNYFILLSLRIKVSSLFDASVISLLVLIGLIAGISIPSIPGKIGVFEYVCILCLGLFDIPQPAALTYGILLHGVVYIPIIVAGLFSMISLGFRHNFSLKMSPDMDPSRQPSPVTPGEK
jgi:glycosyltransferase 2 family protein